MDKKMIYIYDFEYGMQDYIGNMINVPYASCNWERGGGIGIHNIIILSKPFDCIARQVRERGLNSDRNTWPYDIKELWGKYNDSSANFYETINTFIENIDNKFIIHPFELSHSYGKILPRLQQWLDLPDGHIQFNPDEYWDWYVKNVNQM
jgi:hypothetical protein